MKVCRIDKRDREMAERMAKVASWCVQQIPKARPKMSLVVQMLEGHGEIQPPMNPFLHLMQKSPLPDWIVKFTISQSQRVLPQKNLRQPLNRHPVSVPTRVLPSCASVRLRIAKPSS
ncbi:hypothetical protein SLE2022_272260 [Rubroshorea leprosula]